MGSEAADPSDIAAQATRRACRPAGESREGAALFGGGLGEPPNSYPLLFPPGKRADLLSGDGRPYEYGTGRLASRHYESRSGLNSYSHMLGPPHEPPLRIAKRAK